MNTIDLIVTLVVAWAVFNGWRRGFVLQACSLAAIAAGIWFAARWGAEAGGWLGLDPDIRTAGGFAVVLIAVVLLVTIAGRLLRRLFRFAGFGVPDILLGIVVSLGKSLLMLSVAFAAFDSLNDDLEMVDRQTLRESRSYRPIIRLSECLGPLSEWAGEQLPLHNPHGGEETDEVAPQTQTC